MDPWSGKSKVAINRIRVDLPEPLGPNTPKISPVPTEKETWSTATTTGFRSPIELPLVFPASSLPFVLNRFANETWLSQFLGFPNFLYTSSIKIASDISYSFKGKKQKATGVPVA